MQVSVEGTEGAAGTIRYVWRAKNVSGKACRSFGYPGMEVHGTRGWLDLQVHRGGFPDINQAPQHILVAPGHSLYFVSYWSDVTTNARSCAQFDRVKVTLPDNYVSNVLSATGCLNPDSVDVGPVTTSVPARNTGVVARFPGVRWSRQVCRFAGTDRRLLQARQGQLG